MKAYIFVIKLRKKNNFFQDILIVLDALVEMGKT